MWGAPLYSLLRPLLFSLDPETSHSLALALAGLAGLAFPKPPPAPVRVMGIDFQNPVGLAAGLDKQAEHVDALAALGFGFVELGGVTPRPQAGNAKPRMFRLPEARALINRFGLNSVGVEAFTQNLGRARSRMKAGTVIGVNIGKNRDTPNERAAEDYERCLEAVYAHVHYVTLNVSSPNTTGLRDLQSEAALAGIVQALSRKRQRLRDRHGRNVALVLKIAPDLDDAALEGIAGVARRERLDAVMATNTTVSRQGVEGLPHAGEAGGLSGAPLFARSTQVLKSLSSRLKGEVPLIGVGGIMSGEDARAKFAAGAALVQIYSGLIYRGPGLIAECVSAYRKS